MITGIGSGRSILKGSAFSLVCRWLIRLIGLVNVVVIARLLTPEDFGIAAMSALVVGLLETFAEFGVTNLVIRSKNTSREFVDTGWTLQVIQGAIISTLVILSTPFAIDYFEEPRLDGILLFAGLTVFLGGMQSIGVALARKQLKYDADLRFLVGKRLLTFAATIILALWLRSYWALVLGPLIGTAGSVILSFVMFPRRPRFDMSHARSYFKFSLAAIPMSLSYYMNGRIGAYVVGGTSDTYKFGVFNVASELSNMATAEVVSPIGRVLIPNFANLIDHPVELAKSFLFSVQLILTIALPVSLGLSVVADDFVLVVLGDKWTDAGPMIRWLAIYALATGVVQILTTNILIAVNREHLASLIMWARLAIIGPTMVYFGTYYDVETMIIAATVAVTIMIPIALGISTQFLELSNASVIAAIWRSLVAALAMVFWLVQMQQWLPSGIVFLVILVVVGGVTYGAVLLLLWHLIGRPAGIEATILEAIGQRIPALKRFIK